MAIEFKNFEYSFLNSKKKPVFVPNQRCRVLSDRVVELVKERVSFEPYYYHFAKGGHVAALHLHRENRFFARIDLKNFFYTIGRNRVKSALRAIGVREAERIAKWSTVKNPYGQPKYALPYGFPQSPILATLVFRQSHLGRMLDELPSEIRRSVYIDDIAISGSDSDELNFHFDQVLRAAEESGFVLSDEKISMPSEKMTLFNCDVGHLETVVRPERIEIFRAGSPSVAGDLAFSAYCASVEEGNGVEAPLP